jgi:hypothetical protein
MRHEKFFQRLRFECRKESLLIHAGLEADEHLGARFRRDRVPHFGFAASASGLFVHRGVGIVGMHLNGELILREDEFHQQWKIARLFELVAAPFRRHLSPGLA